MIGVVLWSDQVDQKAVIWCEDQGDLAYYTNEGIALDEGPDLEAGDLVRFRMTEHKSVRKASDVAVVCTQSFQDPGIALKSSAKPASRAPARPAPAAIADRGNVIAFRRPESSMACTA